MKTRVGKLLFASALTFLAAAAAAPTPGTAADKEFKLGVVTSLTGERALTGTYARNGVNLALEEINAGGGVGGTKLVAMFEDDGGSDTGAVNAFNKLINLGANAVIAPIYSNMDLAMAPSILKAELPTMVLGSSNDIAKQKNPWMFQVRTPDAVSAVAIANYAAKNLKLKKLAILHDTDNFASGAAAVASKALEGMGEPPVLVESYNGGDKDFTPQLAKIKASGADGVLAWSQMVEAGLIMKQMRSLDLNVPMVGSNSYITKITLDLAKDNAEGVYSVADYVHTNPLPRTQDFAKKYKAKYRIDSEFASAMAYDATYVVAAGYKNAGSTEKAALRKGLASVKDLVGVATTYTFDENNIGGTSVCIVQVKGGAPQIIESIKGR